MGSNGELPLWRLSNAQMRSCHQHEGFSFCLYRARIWKWRWISIATMTGLAEPSQKQRLGVEPEATALLLVLVSHVLLVCTTSLRPSPHQLSIPHTVFKCLDFIHLLLLSAECLKALFLKIAFQHCFLILACFYVLQESWSQVVLSNCNMLPSTISLSLWINCHLGSLLLLTPVFLHLDTIASIFVNGTFDNCCHNFPETPSDRFSCWICVAGGIA